MYEIGSSRATDRIFVPRDGDQRSYHFTRGDSRDLTAETLATQLARAGYVARKRFDPLRHAP